MGGGETARRARTVGVSDRCSRRRDGRVGVFVFVFVFVFVSSIRRGTRGGIAGGPRGRSSRASPSVGTVRGEGRRSIDAGADAPGGSWRRRFAHSSDGDAVHHIFLRDERASVDQQMRRRRCLRTAHHPNKKSRAHHSYGDLVTKYRKIRNGKGAMVHHTRGCFRFRVTSDSPVRGFGRFGNPRRGRLGTADVPLVRVDIRRGTSTRARRPHAAHVPRRRSGASPTRSARRRDESSRGERWGGHLPHPHPPAHPQARVRARRGHRERRRDHHHQVRSRHRRGRQVRRRRRGTRPRRDRSLRDANRGGPGTSSTRAPRVFASVGSASFDSSPRGRVRRRGRRRRPRGRRTTSIPTTTRVPIPVSPTRPRVSRPVALLPVD